MANPSVEVIAPTETQWLSEVTTPSGIEVRYGVKPKRRYEVRNRFMQSDPEKHWTEEWREVPSVTKVLEVLDKSAALSWWAQGIAVMAVMKLLNSYKLRWEASFAGYYLAHEDGREATQESIVALIVAERLSINHVKSKAADRGTGVHNALEAWAAIGKLPEPSEFPEEERGYVTGLRAFLDDAAEGELTAEAFEVTVASVEHGYAGRFDLLARTSKQMKVVTKIFPKWGPKITTVPPSRLLIDLKTSKNIYPTHLLQLEAYEGALVECGYGPTDARAVLHVTADGRYEFRRARATHEQFLAILETYHALKDVEGGMKL